MRDAAYPIPRDARAGPVGPGPRPRVRPFPGRAPQIGSVVEARPTAIGGMTNGKAEE